MNAAPKSQTMVVGLAHFASKADVRNAEFMDPFEPVMQAQIQKRRPTPAAVQPTKVLLECVPANSRCPTEYSG